MIFLTPHEGDDYRRNKRYVQLFGGLFFFNEVILIKTFKDYDSKSTFKVPILFVRTDELHPSFGQSENSAKMSGY